MTKEDEKEEYTFEPILKKSTIASGDTAIGSAGHAPDEDGNISFTIGVKYQIPKQSSKNLMIKSTIHSHREGFATS
jgi:hypothetical protein